MSEQILEIIIYIMVAVLYIVYYYQLHHKTKLARLLLISEVGYRAISSIFVIIEGGITSYWDFVHYIPMFLSVILYFSKGWFSKILFIILSSLMIIIAIKYIFLVFR